MSNNYWLKVKSFADQISLITALSAHRPLSSLEEDNVQELVKNILQEIQTIKQPSLLPPLVTTSSSSTTATTKTIATNDIQQVATTTNTSPSPAGSIPNSPESITDAPASPSTIASTSDSSVSFNYIPPPKKRGRKGADKTAFCCSECKTAVTPEWRKGPSGRNTLCNACGLRWRKMLRCSNNQNQPQQLQTDVTRLSLSSSVIPSLPLSSSVLPPLNNSTTPLPTTILSTPSSRVSITSLLN